jgi:hypothetical protein
MISFNVQAGARGMTYEQATLLATEIQEQKPNIIPQLQHFSDGTSYLLCAYTYKQAGAGHATYQLFTVFSETDWDTWEEEITSLEEAQLFDQILRQHRVLKRAAQMEVTVYLPVSVEPIPDDTYGPRLP